MVPTVQSDAKRTVGAGLLMLGSVMLALGVSMMGSLLWVGWPHTTNLERTFALSLLGLVLGVGGYRIASNTWVDSWQVPHRATALSALLFLGYAVKTMLLHV